MAMVACTTLSIATVLQDLGLGVSAQKARCYPSEANTHNSTPSTCKEGFSDGAKNVNVSSIYGYVFE